MEFVNEGEETVHIRLPDPTGERLPPIHKLVKPGESIDVPEGQEDLAHRSGLTPAEKKTKKSGAKKESPEPEVEEEPKIPTAEEEKSEA